MEQRIVRLVGAADEWSETTIHGELPDYLVHEGLGYRRTGTDPLGMTIYEHVEIDTED